MVLNVSSEIVCGIIAKAREFFAKEEVAFPDSPDDNDRSDDWSFALLANFKDDLTFAELKSSIDDLEPDQQACLVALFWLGRGDFELNELPQAYEEARRNLNKSVSAYLLTKPLLPSYLEDALNQLGFSCE